MPNCCGNQNCPYLHLTPETVDGMIAAKVTRLELQIEDLKMKLHVCEDSERESLVMYRNASERADSANRLNGELKAALDRDKTGLAAALAKIREEVKGRRWICEGRGPYTYDDDRYRQETGFALDAIEKVAADALAASGKLAHEALVEKRICVASVGGLKCQSLVSDGDLCEIHRDLDNT